MRKKIKNSLSAKVFLCTFGLLVLSSLLIYLVAMIVIPERYTIIASDKVSDEIAELAETLSNTEYRQAEEVIEQFCVKNEAYVILGDGAYSLEFGDIGEIEEDEFTTSVLEITFADQATAYMLNVTAPISARHELMEVFVQLLPIILTLILIISALGAWLCNRILVSPVLEISRISKRMANLDMTWRCQLNRSDELGILAESLNSMAIKLGQTMNDLETANKKLQADIDTTRRLERQRRDFFTAVSHELKTPITALKGQIESMILGIGDYKNHDKHLPQAFETVEDMERLVKEILAISKLETAGLGENREDLSLRKMIYDCISPLQPLADEKEITIDTTGLSDRLVHVQGQLFQKALSNIIGNAIRYSPPKAQVIIALQNGVLSIANTGITIDERDFPDLFTPFYRSEKSRNKISGGSGLGLYIVKTIFDLHHIKYALNNCGNGVVFTVDLNQN